MKPLKSNDPKYKCTPVASNCVIWDGPDLPCIQVCTGDSISDITYKLAKLLCEYQAATDLSDLDLKCLFDQCTGCPEPEKSLAVVLQLMIDKLETCCCSEEEEEEPVEADPPLTLPTGLRFEDDNGDTVSELPHTEYSELLAGHLADLLESNESLVDSVADHESRITTLEEAEADEYELPEITSQVIGDGDTHPLNEVVQALDTALDQLQGMTGSASDIATAISNQCESLGTADAFSTSGTMSGLPGWVSSVTTQADSITNMWITICDIREGLASLLSCCSTTCADVRVDFAAVLTDNSETLNLHFKGWTVLPEGFEDCEEGGCTLTITDSNEDTYITTVILSEVSADSSPVQIDMTTTGLSMTSDYTITLESCVTNDTLTCEKVVVKEVTNHINICPTLTAVASTDAITFFFQPILTSNVTYRVELLSEDLSPIVLLATHEFSNTTIPTTGAFTSLNPETTYHIRMVVTSGSDDPVYCSTQEIETLSAE